MGDKTRGLFHKFNIERTDGTSGPGGKHNGCDYFVLDLTHDKHAPAAIKAYADSCREEYPLLAADLDTKFPPAPLPSDKLRGLVRKWKDEGAQRYGEPVFASDTAKLKCADELDSLLSQEPSSGEAIVQANVQCNACHRSLVGVTTGNFGCDRVCKPHGFACGLYGLKPSASPVTGGK